MNGKPDLPTHAPVLEIQPEPSFLPLSRFDFDTIQFIEVGDQPEYVPMPFDSDGNTVVANMLRRMSYFPGLGIGRKQ